jgi:hypothetical protein
MITNIVTFSFTVQRNKEASVRQKEKTARHGTTSARRFPRPIIATEKLTRLSLNSSSSRLNALGLTNKLRSTSVGCSAFNSFGQPIVRGICTCTNFYRCPLSRASNVDPTLVDRGPTFACN